MELKRMKLSLLLGLVAFSGGLAGCDDRVDDVMPPVSEDGLVNVSLSFGFAEETATPVPGSRSGLPFRAPVPGSRSGLASKEA